MRQRHAEGLAENRERAARDGQVELGHDHVPDAGAARNLGREPLAQRGGAARAGQADESGAGERGRPACGPRRCAGACGSSRPARGAAAWREARPSRRNSAGARGSIRRNPRGGARRRDRGRWAGGMGKNWMLWAGCPHPRMPSRWVGAPGPEFGEASSELVIRRGRACSVLEAPRSEGGASSTPTGETAGATRGDHLDLRRGPQAAQAGRLDRADREDAGVLAEAVADDRRSLVRVGDDELVAGGGRRHGEKGRIKKEELGNGRIVFR